MNDESQKLDYATAIVVRGEPLLGRIAMGLVVIAIAGLVVSLQSDAQAIGLSAFALGLGGLVVSLIAVCRRKSRSSLAWGALGVSILFFCMVFFIVA